MPKYVLYLYFCVHSIPSNSYLPIYLHLIRSLLVSSSLREASLNCLDLEG